LLALTSLCIEAYVTVAQHDEAAQTVAPLSALESSSKDAIASVSSIFDRFSKAFHQCASWCDKAIATTLVSRLSALVPPEAISSVADAGNEPAAVSPPVKDVHAPDKPSRSSKRKSKAKKTPVGTPVETLDAENGEPTSGHLLPVIDHVESAATEAVATSVDMETAYMVDNTPTLVQLQQQELLLEAKDGQLQAANVKVKLRDLLSVFRQGWYPLGIVCLTDLRTGSGASISKGGVGEGTSESHAADVTTKSCPTTTCPTKGHEVTFSKGRCYVAGAPWAGSRASDHT
jgi:hypothetical protein